jgi:hypothetical protein
VAFRITSMTRPSRRPGQHRGGPAWSRSAPLWSCRRRSGRAGQGSSRRARRSRHRPGPGSARSAWPAPRPRSSARFPYRHPCGFPPAVASPAGCGAAGWCCGEWQVSWTPLAAWARLMLVPLAALPLPNRFATSSYRYGPYDARPHGMSANGDTPLQGRTVGRARSWSRAVGVPAACAGPAGGGCPGWVSGPLRNSVRATIAPKARIAADHQKAVV